MIITQNLQWYRFVLIHRFLLEFWQFPLYCPFFVVQDQVRSYMAFIDSCLFNFLQSLIPQSLCHDILKSIGHIFVSVPQFEFICSFLILFSQVSPLKIPWRREEAHALQYSWPGEAHGRIVAGLKVERLSDFDFFTSHNLFCRFSPL